MRFGTVDRPGQPSWIPSERSNRSAPVHPVSAPLVAPRNGQLVTSADSREAPRTASRSVARHTGSTLAASGVVLVLVAAANILVGRLLGVDGQGTVAAATLLPMIVAYAGELGIPIATGYLINRDIVQRNNTIATARFVSALLTLGLTALAVILILFVPLGSGVKPLSLVFCVFVGLSLFHRLHLTILQAEMRMTAFNRIRVLGATIYPVMLGLYALTGTASPLAVIVALILANVVWFFSSAWCAASRPIWLANKERARALFRYGLPAHVGNVSSVDGLKLDQLVLAIFLSTNQLGLYVAAITVIIGNRVVGTSIGLVCFPLASRGEGSKSAKVAREFGVLLGVTFALAVVIALCEVLFADQILTLLFGADFARAGAALRVLAVGSVFMNVRQPCAEWLRGCGKPGVVAISEALAVVSLLVLSAFLWDGSIVRVAWIVTISSVVSLVALPRSLLATVKNGERSGSRPMAGPAVDPL